jgi:hypothetical protein
MENVSRLQVAMATVSFVINPLVKSVESLGKAEHLP